VVNLFLQEAGERYDIVRGLSPYRRMTPALRARFDDACAYCASPREAEGHLVEDHLVPRNRHAGGLHAWGNVVPSCRTCNNLKRDRSWREHLAVVTTGANLYQSRLDRLTTYIEEFAYDPDVSTLLPVLEALYVMADQQARGLVKFALAATEPQLGSLRRAAPQAQAATVGPI
jgi:hypothetical protein